MLEFVFTCDGLYCFQFFLFFNWIGRKGVHAFYMESVRYCFLFDGMVRHKINYFICGGRS